MNRRALGGAALALLLATACTDDPTTRAEPSGSPSASTSASASASPSPTRSSPTPAADPATRYPVQRLSWGGCGSGFECATLKVPLDYDKLTGRRIDVSVIRLRASGVRARRIGSILLNPGGPGGSGIDFARQANQLLPSEIRARFDVVSFDPRGVGRSTPVDCVGHADLDRILAADPTPDSPAEKQRLVAVSREEAEGCTRRSGDLLPHIGTIDAARDMEVLRAALGDPKLTYVGFSYGTVLGANYAELFPTRIRALVLDGAVDPKLDPLETALAQAKGFEVALDAFLSHCAASSGCEFRRFGSDLDAEFRALIARIDRQPLSASAYPGRKLGPSEALFGAAAGLYSRNSGWPALEQGLAQAENGDGSTLLALFDSLVDRHRDGSYTNAAEALVAISCVDGVYPRQVSAYDEAARRFATEAPRFGEAIAYGSLPCAFWSTPAVSKAGPVRAPGSPTILVVGTTRDPATPYAWAQSLARQLPRGVLLTYDGDGHTAYGYSRSNCIDRIVDAYLLRLEAPRPGTRC